ncbi:hypothetical protein FB565_000219 [Actinoplanes lutulentus]|uniref:Uncharacterized protein n=1 Tax=Actinoplanes lutulentus TaxID=1287878 RepID=A0A327YWV8_9ACTN|nr:hypothetical protein [Actinoplanes lutulentus]MBB2940515.1 hypothetical protein [Actinoplanes lutulentus]RAK25497.1 hypothetical protein B0I29_13336 [Actinoplanes lutulentus]
MSSSFGKRIVTVCFDRDSDANWFAASELLDELLSTNGTLVERFRVRHLPLLGWLTRFFAYWLINASRRSGAVTAAAGGRMCRLDLDRTAASGADRAAARWRDWHTQVAATTPAARSWEDFLTQHQSAPDKLSEAEARRRFEHQPRVLAMLAHPGDQRLDPYELGLYQAGEATYVGFYWRAALVGDALITTDGNLMRAASNSLADRFRFLNQACAYLGALHGSARVCALAAD